MNILLQKLASTGGPVVLRRNPDRAPSDAALDGIALRELALDRIEQGLCVFDGQQRLLLFNRRYAEMFHLDPKRLQLGTTLREVVDMRYAAGTGPDMAPSEYANWRDRIGSANKTSDTEVVLRNGAVYAIHHEPTADGGWVATFTDIIERRRTEQQVRHMALHDALTGLPNRTLFSERLERALARMRGEERLQDHRGASTDPHAQTGVCFLDLDYFKDINDTLGHAAGDELLRQVAGRVQACLHEGDTLARLGGDEFAILLDGTVSSEAQALALARCMIEAISKPYRLDGKDAAIGATIGIALCSRHDDDSQASSLLGRADIALYRAKESGRGIAEVFRPGMDAALRQRKSMERDLRRAIAEETLDLDYQPLMTLAPRRIVGIEALVRWDHPERGMIPPGEFIPIAETAGLINDLGAWVLRTACADAAGWGELTLAVNLSPEQIRQPGLVELVRSTLADTGLPAHRLELEITEGILLRDTAATVAKLTQLRALGVGIALDDFGTGYSSLSYLRQFPFTKLKVDRSFLVGMMTDPGTFKIVRAIVALGRSLDIRVTVEGIETEAQLEMVLAMHCNEGQGYLLGKPCSRTAFEAMLHPASASPQRSSKLGRAPRGGSLPSEIRVAAPPSPP